LSLVNIFVFLLPLKNIVPGKKRIFEGGKEISLGKFFSTFLSLKGHPLRDRKVEKNFPGTFLLHLQISFSSLDTIFQQD
jgi:hypothetical protein